METLKAIVQDRVECQRALRGLAGVLKELRDLEREEEAKEREEVEEGRGRKRRRENNGSEKESQDQDKEEKRVRRLEDEAVGFDADDEGEDGEEEEAEGVAERRSSKTHYPTRIRGDHCDDLKTDDGLASDFDEDHDDDDDEDDYLNDADLDGGERMDVDEEIGEVLGALDDSYERLYNNMWAMDERLSRIERDVRELGGAGSMLAVVDGQAR